MLFLYDATETYVEAPDAESAVKLACQPILAMRDKERQERGWYVSPDDYLPGYLQAENGDYWKVFWRFEIEYDEDPEAYSDSSDIISDIETSLDEVITDNNWQSDNYPGYIKTLCETPEACQGYRTRCWSGRTSGKLYASARIVFQLRSWNADKPVWG